MAVSSKLIEASFKLGEAGVKQFDPNIAKSQATLVSDLMDPIAKAIEEKKVARDLEIKEKNKAAKKAKDKQMGEFEKNMAAVDKTLTSFPRGGEGGAMNSKIMDVTFDEFSGLKEEWELINTVGDEDTPRNKKKRLEMLGSMESRKNQIVNLRATVHGIAKRAKDGHTSESMNTEDLYIVNSVANMDEDKGYENVNPRWEKENLVFDVTMPDGSIRTVTGPELEEMYVPIPAELENDLLTIGKDNIKASKKSDPTKDKYKIQAGYDGYMGVMKKQTPAAASHIYQTRQEGDPSQGYGGIPGGATGKWNAGSWANALEAHPELNGTYKVDYNDPETSNFNYNISANARNEVVDDLIEADNGINIEDVQLDDDPRISDAEYEAFMNGENRDLAIDVLVNSKNPLFDAELSAGEYSMFKTQRDKAIYEANQPAAEIKAETQTDKNRRLKEKEQTEIAKSVGEQISGGATVLGNANAANAYIDDDGNWNLQKGGTLVQQISKYNPNVNQMLMNHLTGTIDKYGAPEVQGFGQGWTGGTTMQANFPKTEIKSRIEE